MDEDKLGQIVACNLQCSSTFGYSKSELLHKNVTVLMPYVFSKYHDEILKRVLVTNEETISNKDRIVYGKAKSGYVIQLILHVKPAYHALKEGVEFIGIFRKEKQLKVDAILVINNEGIIKDISASCLNILGIDQKSINLQ